MKAQINCTVDNEKFIQDFYKSCERKIVSKQIQLQKRQNRTLKIYEKLKSKYLKFDFIKMNLGLYPDQLSWVDIRFTRKITKEELLSFLGTKKNEIIIDNVKTFREYGIYIYVYLPFISLSYEDMHRVARNYHFSKQEDFNNLFKMAYMNHYRIRKNIPFDVEPNQDAIGQLSEKSPNFEYWKNYITEVKILNNFK